MRESKGELNCIGFCGSEDDMCELIIDADDAEFIVQADVGYELIWDGTHDDLQDW